MTERTDGQENIHLDATTDPTEKPAELDGSQSPQVERDATRSRAATFEDCPIHGLWVRAEWSDGARSERSCPDCPGTHWREDTPEREETSMVTDQGTTRIVFGKDSNGFIETTEGRPPEDEGAWRVYTSGYAVLGWDDLLAIGRWIAEHERRRGQE